MTDTEKEGSIRNDLDDISVGIGQKLINIVKNYRFWAVVLVIISIIFMVVICLVQFDNQDKIENKQEPVELIATATATIMPTATATVTPISSPTLKPTSVPTIKLTATPTIPTEVINTSFSCGTYGGDSWPPYPAMGPTPLFVSLYPSGSAPNLAGFQWDYDGDGSWDSEALDFQANRVYETAGNFRPKFRVKVTNGEYGPTCTYPFEVRAGSSSEYQNETIAIDKLYTEVTVSKSKQNFEFDGPEINLNNINNNTIIIPFLTVSSKEDFTAIRLKLNNSYSGYGTYEGGKDMREGTAYRQNLFIDKNKENGVYEGEFIITYTVDRGTVTREAPAARYKITLTD